LSGEQIAIIVLGVFLSSAFGVVVWTNFKLARILMHFHQAGYSMANHEIQMKQIEVEKIRAENEKLAQMNREMELSRQAPQKSRAIPASEFTG